MDKLVIYFKKDKKSTNKKPRNKRKNEKHENNEKDGKQERQQKKREPILDLQKYKDSQIKIKFVGGRQVTGKLTGYDQMMNLVLEDAVEVFQDLESLKWKKGEKRELGQVFVKSGLIMSLFPADSSMVIDNPFVSVSE